jgi:transporter family protein
MFDIEIFVGILFLSLRILFLGTERIFLSKNRLGKYNSIAVSSLFFLIASISLLPGLILVPIDSFQLNSGLLFSMFSGLFYSVGFYSYVKALSKEDASLIAPLYNSSLLWLLLLSAIFLHDSITFTRILGSLIIFVGFFFLYSGSLTMKLQKIKDSKASLLMIGGSFFIALGRTIDAFVVSEINQVLYAICMNLFVGIYLFIIVLVTGNINQIKTIFSNDGKDIFYSGLINGWAYLFLLIAILYLEVTIAEPASLLSIFVTAFLAKKFLEEHVRERMPGIIIIVFGSIFLFVDIF